MIERNQRELKVFDGFEFLFLTIMRESGFSNLVSTLRPIMSRKNRGTIILDENANVLFANKQAHDLCSKSETISIDNGSLNSLTSSQNIELESNLTMVAQQKIPKTVFWQESSFSHPVRMDIFPVLNDKVFTDPATAPLNSVPTILTIETIGLRTPKISPKFTELYKLTPTEFETVKSLAQGMSLSAFADKKGNCISTVRWTVRNIFAKTKTNSQRELVALANLFFD